MNNEIKKLDFGSGIRAQDINNNFEILGSREKRDRLRGMGFGIVEGFSMSLGNMNQVIVGEGYFINKEGKEVLVLKQEIGIDFPEAIKRNMADTGDALSADYEGQFTLPERPYSPSRKAQFDTDSYQESYLAGEDELIIRNASNLNEKIQAVRVDGRNVTLDAGTRRGQEVFVEYYYVAGRVDILLLDVEGNIRIEKGISSEAPSHVDRDQYQNEMILGLVETRVDGAREIVLHYDYRTYTKVYVNESNVLHLNGKAYEEVKMIHFEEPSDPNANDVWYDGESNRLFIWKETNGEPGWTAVNEASHIPVRQVKIFSPEEFPADSQTFLFKDELPMRFIPDRNQVEVIIDNSPLMSDQFIEVLEEGQGEYINEGIGIKLKDPLDKAAYVEVRVHHSVQTGSLRRTFQRTAVFAQEGYVYHKSANTSKEFATEAPYVIGEHQLQVFVEGKRLQEGLDFEEIPGSGMIPGAVHRGKSSSIFRIRTALVAGERVSYRIEKNIYSYDNLDGWVDEIEMKADQALGEIEDLRDDVGTLESNVARDLKVINGNVLEIGEKVGELTDYYKKTDKIERTSLATSSLNSMKKNIISKAAPAGGAIIVEAATVNDYMLLAYNSERMSRVLIKDVDYVSQAQGSNVIIVLDNTLVDSSATVYVSGIRFGE